MIIGDQSRFAIEFQLNKEYGGVWLFGKICFWIEGRRVGDFDLGTSLRDVFFQMRSIVQDNGNRNHEGLFALSKNELYNQLNAAVYGSEINESYQLDLEETWARFDVKIPVDIFDQWKIFLVEDTSLESARLVVAKLDVNEVFETFLDQSEVDKVLLNAYDELNKLYEFELKKNKK